MELLVTGTVVPVLTCVPVVIYVSRGRHAGSEGPEVLVQEPGGDPLCREAAHSGRRAQVQIDGATALVLVGSTHPHVCNRAPQHCRMTAA